MTRARAGAAIFLLGFALRAAIIAGNPIIFGGDPLIRLVRRDKLLMSYQLPMLQVLISAVSKISLDPALVRYMLAVIGAIAGLAFYWVVADLAGERWVFPAALLFVTNPFLLVLSTVPYQEILMIAGLLLAFHFFYTENWLVASVCLAVACLTRYEAWAACPVLAVAYILRKDRSIVGCLKAALLFGWAPAMWMLAQRGLTSPGNFVVERSLSIWRLQRYVYLGWITAKYTTIPVLLAVVGAWRFYKDRTLIDWRWRIQIAFVALFLIAVPFSAHGVMPDPERYVTAREAHIPIYFVSLLAALGLALWPRWTRAIVAVSIVVGLMGAWWYLRYETSDPETQLSWRLAQYLDHSVREGERALILAKPAPDLQPYLDKVRQTGGEEGLRQARLNLQEAGLLPVDYLRVQVHSRLKRDRLLASNTACAEWIAVWSDYPDAASALAGGRPVEVLSSGPLHVTILRRQCPQLLP